MAGKRRVIVAGQSHANTLFGGRHRDFEAPTLVKLKPDAIVTIGAVDATPAAATYGLVDASTADLTLKSLTLGWIDTRGRI